MSIAATAPQPASVPLDVLETILKEYLNIWAFSAADITELCHSSLFFRYLFQPFMYRHVNMRTISNALSFFHTVGTRPDLAKGIETLQFSFNTNPGPNPPSDEAQLFWSLLRGALPSLSNLETLSLCYSREDWDFLDRYMESGDLSHILPANIGILHFKPLPSEDSDKDLDEPDENGPWQSNTWSFNISRLPHIHTLIVSTPTYLLWPSEDENHDLQLSRWTSQWRSDIRFGRSPSNLSTIVLNYGYGDLGGRMFSDDSDDDMDDPDIFTLRTVMVDNSGIQIVWQRDETNGWEVKEIGGPSGSDRTEYFFGSYRDEYSRPWLHVNERQVARSWRREQRQVRFCGMIDYEVPSY
ncbi:hypothetical protein B0H12DRAFT_1071277 [Mycena haematopus]|nr:hypothetical protein B0H12DRAFT_1071277 [Mycena haematopus]